MSRLYPYADGIGYYYYKSDTIYGIDRTSLEMTPRYVLNLGSKLRPRGFDINTDDFYNSKIYITTTPVAESDRYLFISSSYNDLCYLSYFDKKTGETSFLGNHNVNGGVIPVGFDDDIMQLVPFFPTSGITDGWAYQLIQAVDLVAYVGDRRAAELGISEEDNPVIIAVLLKE